MRCQVPGSWRRLLGYHGRALVYANRIEHERDEVTKANDISIRLSDQETIGIYVVYISHGPAHLACRIESNLTLGTRFEICIQSSYL